MHLKSSNGPIDVLVCPEAEDDNMECSQQLPQTTGESHTNSLILTPRKGHLEVCLTPTHNTPDRVVQHTPKSKREQFNVEDDKNHYRHSEGNSPSSLPNHSTPQRHDTTGLHIPPMKGNAKSLIEQPLRDDLDISLNSAADMCNSNDLKELMDSYNYGSSHLLASPGIGLSCFESLDPPLQDEDFSFALDDTNEGIQDLFDLVS